MNIHSEQEEGSHSQFSGKRRKSEQRSDGAKLRKMLNKTEKAKVLLAIMDFDIQDALEYVKKTVEGENHIQMEEEKTKFWDNVKSCQFLSEVIQVLGTMFSTIYKSCGQGKNKYMAFQLEWHRCCSLLLQRDTSSHDTHKHPDLSSLYQRWVGFCEGSKGVTKDVQDSIMISVSSAIYNYFLKIVSKAQQTPDSAESTVVAGQDETSVYYRFCGAALASMLHCRYEKRFKRKHKAAYSINREIQVLKCIECDDKDHIPYELKYRDQGHMYFPAKYFLGFLKKLDTCVTENANETTFRK